MSDLKMGYDVCDFCTGEFCETCSISNSGESIMFYPKSCFTHYEQKIKQLEEEKTALEKSIQAHQKCIDNLEKENEKLKEFSKDKCDTCKFKVNGVYQYECLECHRFYSDLYTAK